MSDREAMVSVVRYDGGTHGTASTWALDTAYFLLWWKANGPWIVREIRMGRAR